MERMSVILLNKTNQAMGAISGKPITHHIRPKEKDEGRIIRTGTYEGTDRRADRRGGMRTVHITHPSYEMEFDVTGKEAEPLIQEVMDNMRMATFKDFATGMFTIVCAFILVGSVVKGMSNPTYSNH